MKTVISWLGETEDTSLPLINFYQETFQAGLINLSNHSE